MAKKYEEIAGQIATWIRASAYSSGDKLPSIRYLSQVYRVSITTVVSALRILESRGIVEARDRVGYYVGKNLQENETKREFEKINPRNLAGNSFIRDLVNLNHRSAVPLGSAIPAEDYLPKRQIQRSLLKSARRASDTLSYSFPGHPQYLAAIARRMTNIGVTSTEADVIAMSGAQESLIVALRSVAREGDTVAIGSPTYPGILHALKVLRLKVVEVPCHRGGPLSFEALEFAVANFDIKAMCISVNVSNPTGYTFTEDERIRLLRICGGKGIPIIEDDIYGDLYFGNQRPLPLKALDSQGAVIYCSSFSKTISPGLRAGWIMPGKYYSEVSDQKYFLNLATPAVIQIAVADYLEGGSYDLYLRKIRKIYQKNVQKLRDLVLNCFPEGTTCSNPDGGYLVWVTLPFDLDTSEVYETALENGIYFAPGKMFSVAEQNAKCLRISGAHPLDSTMQASVLYIAEQFREAGNQLPPLREPIRYASCMDQKAKASGEISASTRLNSSSDT